MAAMNSSGQVLPRRNPKIPEDSVFYSIYSDDIKSSSPPNAAATDLRPLLLRIHSILAPLISTYIWQHEPFILSTVASSTSCRLCGSPPIPHFHGKTRFGDNLEDEWFIVFLLFEISRAFPSLSIRVWDSDGEFLLIETAFSLPRWLNPDSSPNRIFIRAGDLHIVPKCISSSTPSLTVSLEALRNPETDTKASNSIQSILKKKISGYPEKARANMHRAVVTVPLKVAQVLKHEPCLISLAVEGFYDRDVDSMKHASRMEKYLRTEKAEGEIEMVRVSVEMSRAMYAQLVQQRFQAPRCYPMPGREDGPVAYKEAELGMKIACGFEMMYQERKRAGKEGKGSTWDAFKESLERSGCFNGMLPGSMEYQRIMDNALEYYKSSSLFSRTRDILTAPLKRIDEILTSVYSINDFKDMHIVPPDDDSWLYNGEDELNSAILERQMEMEAYESKHRKEEMVVGEERFGGSSSQTKDFNLKDVAESMQAFVRKVSSFEGAEVPDDWSEEVKLDAELFLKEIESVAGPVPQGKNSFDADLEELNWSSDMDFDSEEDDDMGENAIYDDTEDTFMQSYSDALNQELSSTALKNSFIRAARQPDTEDEGTSNSWKHADEDLTPVDVDMNLVQSFLESFASQQGLPGPASNMLGLMGLNVPASMKET
ncbi:protein ecdysoneless homolog isoform X2 [Phalaenopsis equestris]|uniref:protein ecdysoneless homolog isoform X2 n=1 Tax=Phalaenopsis equestris TaxID=78828 RepID=UPI0009E64B28|nr:protein ecdysoneless homolog isoform X2 [Phalaenopsis equestris]